MNQRRYERPSNDDDDDNLVGSRQLRSYGTGRTTGGGFRLRMNTAEMDYHDNTDDEDRGMNEDGYDGNNNVDEEDHNDDDEIADANAVGTGSPEYYYQSIVSSAVARGSSNSLSRLREDDYYFSPSLRTPTGLSEIPSRRPRLNMSPTATHDANNTRHRSADMSGTSTSNGRVSSVINGSNNSFDADADVRDEFVGLSSAVVGAPNSRDDSSTGPPTVIRRSQHDRASGATSPRSSTSATTTATTATVPNRSTRLVTTPTPRATGSTSMTTPTSAAESSTPGGGSTAGTPATMIPNLPPPPPPPSALSSSKTIHAVETLDALYRCPQLREVSGTGNHGSSSSLSEALSWQLSSAKPGNGVEQIRDNSVETYWQSDGITQPHWIQIHFQRRIAISHLALYLDYHLDESYTPKTVAVDVGTTPHDLVCATSPISKIEFNEPSGWCIIPLCAPPDPLDSSDYYDDEYEDYYGLDSIKKKKKKNRNANGEDDENNDDDDDNDEDEEEDGDDEDECLDLEKQLHRPLLKAHMIRISILSMHQNGRDTHVRRIAIFARIQPQELHRFNPLTGSMAVFNQRVAEEVNDDDDDEIMNENSDEISALPSSNFAINRALPQLKELYIESWNHRRNPSFSSDFSTIGRNRYSTIR